MHNKSYQQKIILAILTTVIIFTSVIILLKNASGKSNLYSNEYYSLSLPQNCDIQEDEFNTSILYNNKKIATITVEEDFQYGGNAERIVANWIGMHASVNSDSAFFTYKNDEFHKVSVKSGLSAAQEINKEKPEADEIHYFYLSKKNLFVDIMVYDDEYITLIEDLVKSFTLK